MTASTRLSRRSASAFKPVITARKRNPRPYHVHVRRLSLDSTDDLTLANAIDICRAIEATRSRVQSMGDTKPASAVINAYRRDDQSSRDRRRSKSGVADKVDGVNCGNCGRQHNPKRRTAFRQVLPSAKPS